MLNSEDRARVQQDAFSTNLQSALGAASMQALDLKTQLDVARMELGVAADLIAAKESAKVQAERDCLEQTERAETAEAQVTALEAKCAELVHDLKEAMKKRR